VHTALTGLGQAVEAPVAKQMPAVPIRSSVKPDYIVSLESGKKMKMLKRYLMTNDGLTPDQYPQKWNLPADEPMVAPNYAEARRGLAMKIGLGRKPAPKMPKKRGSRRSNRSSRKIFSRRTKSSSRVGPRVPTSGFSGYR
jgi:predicted transcriptional regulator